MMKYYKKLLIVTIGTITLMQGCNSHSAPNLPKSWQPMNQLSDQITEIPLIRPHFLSGEPARYYGKRFAREMGGGS